jgi:hypothetical protein
VGVFGLFDIVGAACWRGFVVVLVIA